MVDDACPRCGEMYPASMHKAIAAIEHRCRKARPKPKRVPRPMVSAYGSWEEWRKAFEAYEKAKKASR